MKWNAILKGALGVGLIGLGLCVDSRRRLVAVKAEASVRVKTSARD